MGGPTFMGKRSRRKRKAIRKARREAQRNFAKKTKGPEKKYGGFRALGFASYVEYLKSPLWHSIRETVFATFGNRCCVCGSMASEIHHKKYTIAVLLGQEIDSLVPICHPCHAKIEFRDGVKVGLSAANARLHELETQMFMVRQFGPSYLPS